VKKEGQNLFYGNESSNSFDVSSIKLIHWCFEILCKFLTPWDDLFFYLIAKAIRICGSRYLLKNASNISHSKSEANFVCWKAQNFSAFHDATHPKE